MSSAGFTGKAHLLSSERSDNIPERPGNVKDFFGLLTVFYFTLVRISP